METQKFKEGTEVYIRYRQGHSSWYYGSIHSTPGSLEVVKDYDPDDNSYYLSDSRWYHEDELVGLTTSLTYTNCNTHADYDTPTTLSTNVTKTKINFNY